MGNTRKTYEAGCNSLTPRPMFKPCLTRESIGLCLRRFHEFATNTADAVAWQIQAADLLEQLGVKMPRVPENIRDVEEDYEED